MVRAAVKYLARNPSKVTQVLRDPMQLYSRLYNKLDANIAKALEFRHRAPEYSAAADWQERLHKALGHEGPCHEEQAFRNLWTAVTARLEARGFSVGPESYFAWNDGDPALTRAIWCIVRHLRPERVVETGVGHGITTRFILEAMQLNSYGQLWSIDLPPVDPAVAAQVGVAVEGPCESRWTLLRGTSRHLLPRLLRELEAIDLFIHDSQHTHHNVRFELRQAQRAVRQRGLIVVDDIDTNAVFAKVVRDSPEVSLVCEAEPVRPDLRRFNKKGLFGVILPRRSPSTIH
jgi:predicted O-methyltransferase YrrM